MAIYKNLKDLLNADINGLVVEADDPEGIIRQLIIDTEKFINSVVGELCVTIPYERTNYVNFNARVHELKNDLQGLRIKLQEEKMIKETIIEKKFYSCVDDQAKIQSSKQEDTIINLL